MTCPECLLLLQSTLDGEATAASPALALHLAQCSSCRSLHASGQVLLRGLKALPAPVLAPDFSQRLTGLVLEDRRIRKNRLHRRLRITKALAASILIMAVAGYFLLPIPPSTPHSDPFAKENQRPAPENVAAGPQLAQSVDDARQGFTALSGRWADQAKEQTKMLIAAAPSFAIPGIDSYAAPLDLEPAAQSLQQAGQAVTDGLKPVAKTTQRAFTYFIRELPVLDEKN